MGFDPMEYSVTESEVAMLRIVLSSPFTEEVSVSLRTASGSADGKIIASMMHLSNKEI